MQNLQFETGEGALASIESTLITADTGYISVSRNDLWLVGPGPSAWHLALMVDKM